MDQPIVQKIREFIVENFLFDAGEEAFGDDDSFLETGIIDSTGILELAEWVEETFGFPVDDMDLVPDNFDSVNRLAAFIERQAKAAG